MNEEPPVIEAPYSPESRYRRQTPLAHRRRHGQFFTPEEVAACMARWICAGDPHSVLDPAHGLGVFHRHVQAILADRPVEYVAYENDPEILAALDDPRDHRLQVIAGDYLAAGYRAFDAIICNPPYLQFQKFAGRHRVLRELEAVTGARLGGCSNMAAAFLLKALHQLAPGGRLAFLVPMEFFDTRYGAPLRRRLTEDGLLKQVFVLPDDLGVFPDAVTSVAVVFCRRDGRPDDVAIRRITSLAALDAPGDAAEDACDRHVTQLPLAVLQWGGKWSDLLAHGITDAATPAPAGYLPLRHYGRFLRGIATGANSFFMGSRAQFAARGILPDQLLSCIGRSAQVRGAMFTGADHARLDHAGKPVWCLDAQEPAPAAVRAYLAEGEAQAVHQRYLTSRRQPWYRVEQRAPSPLWVGTFYRGRLKVVRNEIVTAGFIGPVIHLDTHKRRFHSQPGTGTGAHLFVRRPARLAFA